MPPALVEATERRLGDLLLERGYVTSSQLLQALSVQKTRRDEKAVTGPVGEILVELGHLTPDELRETLAILNKTWFLDAPVANWDARPRDEVPYERAQQLHAVPLLTFADELVIVAADPLGEAEIASLRRHPHDNVRQIFASPLTVAAGLQAVYESPLREDVAQPRLGTRLVQSGEITVAELVDALQEQVLTGDLLGDILLRLGYISERGLARYVSAVDREKAANRTA